MSRRQYLEQPDQFIDRVDLRLYRHNLHVGFAGEGHDKVYIFICFGQGPTHMLVVNQASRTRGDTYYF